MAKPRTKNGSGVKFPYIFQKNGRTGRVKKWGDGKFGTYFLFGSKSYRNSFRSFEAAHEYLEREFSTLDTERVNSTALFPVNHDLKTYSELEEILRTKGGGATLRDSVQFYIDHHKSEKFKPRTVAECVLAFLIEEKSRNLSTLHCRTLTRHLKHFEKRFGTSKIHDVTAQEIADWLRDFRQKNGRPWAVKTRISVRGTVVSLFIFSRDILKAVAKRERTEAQLVKNPQRNARGEVGIYSAAQLRKLLDTALEVDVTLIPALVFGAFQGLRPDEFHGENVKERRQPLQWKSVDLQDHRLDVLGKVRVKARRLMPLFPVSEAWLAPFKQPDGSIWTLGKSYTYKMRNLFRKAEVSSVYDGLRHSYASYRARHLQNNLNLLADEMGNSPTEIVKSYKATVTDKEADEWFAITPPDDYAKTIKTALSLRKTF